MGPTTEPYRQGSHVPAALDQAGVDGVDYLVPLIGLLNSQFAVSKTEPGYMVHFAARLKRDTGLPTEAAAAMAAGLEVRV